MVRLKSTDVAALVIDEARTPWQRQPGEGSRAFEAFALYRDLTAGERSGRLVAQELGKSATIVFRWSVRWSWRERVEAWDDHCDRETQRTVVSARLEAARRQAHAARAIQDFAWQRLKASRLVGVSGPHLVRVWELAARVEREALRLVESPPAEPPEAVEAVEVTANPAQSLLDFVHAHPEAHARVVKHLYALDRILKGDDADDAASEG